MAKIETTNELPGTEVLESQIIAQQQEQQEAQDELLDYKKAKIHLQRLVKDWLNERQETLLRRAEREVNIDVEALRQKGKLDDDETLIPVRVIDTNIQREQPAYINYLKNSRRLVTFNSLENSQQDTQTLELEFTRGMTYMGWETPHFKTLDGAQTHGWDSVEVVLDYSKPLHVALESVGHDNLFFPRSSIDIQFAARVIRRYEVTLLQLDKFVATHGFAQEQIQKLKDARKDSQKAMETVEVYKHMCKKDGTVYVSWFCLENGVEDWLKAPVPLDLELVDPKTGAPKATTIYPYFILPYRESERPHIVDHKGRVYYDRNKQEAQTAILSGFVNGLTRAANIYASPKNEDGTGASLKELDGIALVGGRIFNKPIDFWSTPYPDPGVLRALQYFDVANSQETNQPTFAVNNREDSRKTATEMNIAQQQQQLLNSVQLTMFSKYVREVYTFCWLLVQSQALAGKISFLLTTVNEPVIGPLGPVVDPMTGQPLTQPVTKNNTAIISQAYDIRAAGDVDVIQRQEKINQMMQDWPVISQTPLRDKFLQDLIRLKYPDVGEQYVTLLAQQPQMDAMKGIIGRLATIMQGAMQQNPEMMTSLPPEQQADVGNLVQQGIAMAQQQTPQQ